MTQKDLLKKISHLELTVNALQAKVTDLQNKEKSEYTKSVWKSFDEYCNLTTM